jgi:hypothetical protein
LPTLTGQPRWHRPERHPQAIMQCSFFLEAPLRREKAQIMRKVDFKLNELLAPNAAVITDKSHTKM